MTDTVTRIQIATLDSSCTCQYCQDCGMSWSRLFSDECPECKSHLEFSDCYGESCYRDAWEDACNEIALWMSKQKIDNVVIDGWNMGWRHLSGHSQVLQDPEAILRALMLNGDWSLEILMEGENDVIEIIRRSHDELGALFRLREATEEEMSE